MKYAQANERNREIENDFALFESFPLHMPLTISHDQPIPPGWVITAVNAVAQGENAPTANLTIRRPYEEDTVCECSPIPRGYVIVGRSTSESGEIMLKIKKPRRQEIICQFSPVPGGYMVVGLVTSPAFGEGHNNARLIERYPIGFSMGYSTLWVPDALD